MPRFEAFHGLMPFAALATACAVATFALLPALLPLLRRYALARPNARSSHKVPTPQGGGIAVVGIPVLVLSGILLAVPGIPPAERLSLATLLLGSMVLALVGAWDDIRPLPAGLRLVVQAVAVALVVFTMPADARLLPGWLGETPERVLLTVAALWFVNLTNFMDGLDWITAAGFVPLCGALALLAAFGAAPVAAGLVGATLGGALVGFAPMNRPVARVFLGDVGSLPIGLLAAYALFRLGGSGALLAAAMLPLYHAADATITLGRRLVAGEKVWEAHRSHFYQRATTNGLSVMDVVTRIVLVNCGLAGAACILAVAWTPGRAAIAAVFASASVAALLADFSTRRTPS